MALAVALLVGAGAGYLVGNANERTTTSILTATITVSTITLPTGNFANRALFINVNGSLYYADNISSDMVIQNPGYAYLRNASVAFDRVKFETICPQGYSGCPPSGTTTAQVTQIPISAFSLKMTFPDGSEETTGNIIGDSTYVFSLSQHRSPRAGMLIEYVKYNYQTYLLVST